MRAVNMKRVRSIAWYRNTIYVLIGIILGLVIGTLWLCTEATAATLPDKRQDVADQIAEICIDEWDNYGRLPSIAVSQAFVESTLGEGPNLFGVKGDAGKNTVASTYGYLNCLSNEYFRGRGAFSLSREYQLTEIMKNGDYCAGEYPEGSYYYRVLNSILDYKWTKYDKVLRQKLRTRKKAKIRAQKAKKRKRFRAKSLPEFEFDDSLAEWQIITDPDYISGGAVIIAYQILDVVKTEKGLGNKIKTGSSKLALFYDGNRFTEVIEEAKG